VRLRVEAPGVEEPAVSDHWLVWRAREPTGDVLRMLDLTVPDRVPTDIRRAHAPDRIGRPSVDGDRVVYHLAVRGDHSAIEEIYLPTRRRTRLRTGRNAVQLLNPSELAGTLLYISSSNERQLVRIGARRARTGDQDRTLFRMHAVTRRDAGHEPNHERHAAGYPGGKSPKLPERAPEGVSVTLWSTALAPGGAYVSRMRRAPEGPSTPLLRHPRCGPARR
jgi:dipeptidyl aminopeptidase/acylaminoacyl peptidase